MAFKWLQNTAGRLFGYDAVTTTGKRKQPPAALLSEDETLRRADRRRLISGTRELQRNFSIAAWALRKHLDYVSTFNFQARTGDRALDDEIESLMAWWSRPTNCDSGGRHSLQRLVRLCEARATLDGDVLLNMLADGRIQAIESERIDSHTGAPLESLGIDPNSVVNGVWVNPNGRAIAYIVNRREPNGNMVFDGVLSASFAHLHGYFDRFDQVRGISPLAPAINSLRDVYEGFDFALAKMKVSQLFALAFFRENSEQMGVIDQDSTSTSDDPRYKVDFGRGPVMLDLDPGDRAEFLESKNPSTEFQAFTQSMIGVALKALDIPFSFYDESHTNYSGARQALLQYDQSAEQKRQSLRVMLDRVAAWRLQMFVDDGDLRLPRGVRASDLKWEWVAAGIPWIDPLKEVTADVTALGAGLTSPQRVCKAYGEDYFQIIDELAAAQSYAAEKGVNLSFAVSQAAQQMVVAQDNKNANDQTNPSQGA